MKEQNTNLTPKENRRLTSMFLRAANDKDVEKAVERATIDFIETAIQKRLGTFGSVSTSFPYNTDGIVRFKPKSKGSDEEKETLGYSEFFVLAEAKKDLDFSGNSDADRKLVLSNRAVVLAQVVYYFYRIREAEGRIPSAVVVADNDEVFILSGKVLESYLNKNYDWKVAPSSAGEKNPELVQSLIEDKNVSSIYVYHIEEGFNFNAPAERLFAAIENSKFRKIVVNPTNLARSFEDFNRRVFGGSTQQTRLQVSIFLQSLLGSKHIFPHPQFEESLMYSESDSVGSLIYKSLTPSKELPLDLGAYQEFFEEHDRNSYTFQEQKAITQIADVLIDDFDRRFTGDFWTPKIWVEEAHLMISSELNEYETDSEGNTVLGWDGTPKLLQGTKDWKEEFVVWDAAAGPKILTRDFDFDQGHLFSSTLHSEEIALARDLNPGSVTFQYDFLGDDLVLHSGEDGRLPDSVKASDLKMPTELFDSLKDRKPIVFFMNPPYGQATEQSGQTKNKIAKTGVSDLMHKAKMGRASSELYLQFLYRIQQLAKAFGYDEDDAGEMHIFIFNKVFFTTPIYRKFLEQFNKDFEFQNGFMMNAGEFHGTSSAWGVTFSHWVLDPDEDRSQTFFPFPIKESFVNADQKMEIEVTGDWTGRSVERGETISNLIPSQSHRKVLDSFPTTSNGFTPSTSKTRYAKMCEGAFGWAQSGGSSVQFSDKYTNGYSFAFNNGQGFPITEDNFEEIAVLLAVRKSWNNIIREGGESWIRDKDNFLVPTEGFRKGKEWPEFVVDSVVYSLFSSGSKYTSLRDYEYDGEKWYIPNHFFWKSKEFISQLADERDGDGLATENFNVDIQKDLHFHGEPRYTANWLKENVKDLSAEALSLLEVADKILLESFKYREGYSSKHPEYHLNTWDAGWYQLYKMLYSRDADSAAKKDATLKKLKNEFDGRVKTLGNKIAHQYANDTGF